MSRWRKSRPKKNHPVTAAPETPMASRAAQTLVIGQWLTVKGDVSAECDVRIDGTVEGSVEVPENKLTVGVSGRVTADVRAHSVLVRGLVVGDIVAEDRVEVLAAGSVCGKITARRVVLAEGSRVNGDVNMGVAVEPPAEPVAANAKPSKAQAVRRKPVNGTPANGKAAAKPPKDRFGRPFPMWTMVESGDA